ncbi:hypothetical protein VTL71DRAFT_2287, partial [Oculimacula yallundae]
MYLLHCTKATGSTSYSELEQRLQYMEKALVESRPDNQTFDIRSSAYLPQVSESGSYMPYRAELMISRAPVVDPHFLWSTPEKGLLEPLDITSLNTSPALEGDECPAGSIPIFSGRGIQWIDQLLGDRCFSTMVQGLRPPDPNVDRNLGLLISTADVLPNHKLAEAGVQGFFSTVNRESHFFQEDQIASYMYLHGSGRETPKAGYIAATNIMIAFQKFGCYTIRYKIDTDVYVGNALALLPRLIMEGASTLNVGAALSIALYFIFANEFKPAASILGTAVQMMVTAGYNSSKREPDTESLFKDRLFWNAYIMSSDISIYLGKAPIIFDSAVFNLPEMYPPDSLGDLAFQDGSTFNVIYERVELSRLQCKTWSMLYSPEALELPHHQIYDRVIELEHELETWNSRLRAITGDELYDDYQGRLVYLTLLHLRYYQLVISIHSVLFTRPSSPDRQIRMTKASPSVARCVQATRHAISLLNHFNEEHPFMGLLAPGLAWCCDILCIHVLQNKNTPDAYQDVARLEKVAKIFEKFAGECDSKFQSQVTNMLYFIAAYGVRVSQTVTEQPADASDEINFFPLDYGEIPQNTSIPMKFEPMPQNEDIQANFGVPFAPQFRSASAQGNEPTSENNFPLRVSSFFIATL